MTVERFGGLNFRDDPQEVGTEGCIDCLNVDIDRRGRVRTRDGYTQFNDTTLSSTGYSLVAGFGGPSTSVLIGLRTSTVNCLLDTFAIDGTSTNIGTWAAGSGTISPGSFATIGTSTASYFYVTSWTDTTGVTIRRFDGTTLATGTGSPAHVAVAPWSNRLVQGHYFAAANSPSGANGTLSTVFFSDAGAPDTYTATNWLHLHPGDGEAITAMVTWRELLFVFKQSKCFVFYGETTDETGEPVFNYRVVNLPTPVWYWRGAPSSTFACAAPDGVYYGTNSGVYRMTGGEPVLVTDELSPLFQENGTFPSTLEPFGTPPSVVYAGGRLLASYKNSTQTIDYTLVYNFESRQWTVWKLGSAGVRTFASWPPLKVAGGVPDGDVDSSIFFPIGNNIMRMLPGNGTADDAGTAIASHYQSGFYDLGTPQDKTIRETILWGTGSPTYGLINDHGTSDSLAAAVTLGTSPAVAEGRQRITRTGTLFSHKFSATSGLWAVNRMTHYIRESRVPGMKAT